LDAKAAAKIEETVKDLRESRGLAILWVTHDIEQAGRMADKVVVLGKGPVKGAVGMDSITGGDAPG
jgi:ABC-type glutathione transport system ATPase component